MMSPAHALRLHLYEGWPGEFAGLKNMTFGTIGEPLVQQVYTPAIPLEDVGDLQPCLLITPAGGRAAPLSPWSIWEFDLRAYVPLDVPSPDLWAMEISQAAYRSLRWMTRRRYPHPDVLPSGYDDADRRMLFFAQMTGGPIATRDPHLEIPCVQRTYQVMCADEEL